MSRMNANPRWPGLRAELISRAKRDQEARSALADPPSSAQWDAVRGVDAENAPWLEDIVAKYGWPGAKLVGEDGAHAAWLLAQVRHEALFYRVEVRELHRRPVAAGRRS